MQGALDAVAKVSPPMLLLFLFHHAFSYLWAYAARPTRFAIRDWQAFGLIVRRINDENFGEPSMPGSRPVTIKFMIPNSRMGSV